MKPPDEQHMLRMTARNAESRFNEIMRQRDTPRRQAELRQFWDSVTIAKSRLGGWPARRANNKGKKMIIISADFVHATCAPEPGNAKTTCSYLLMGAGGWSCAKEEAGLKRHIDERRAAGSMRAQADNCSGPPLFQRGT